MPVPPKLPPIASEPLSVVLLAREDAAHVEAVLSGWLGFLDARGQTYELLLVDDGSTDGTADLASALARARPCLEVLRHDRPSGEGAALRTGLARARHPLVFYTLCRPEYRPADMARLLDLPFLHDDPDAADPGTPPPAPSREIDHVHVMSGYRAGVPVPWPLRVVGWTWRTFFRIVFSFPPTPLPGWLGWRRHLGWLLTRIFFGLRHHDVLCPFRLLRRDILARMPIQSDGPFAHVELLAKANFLGCMICEEIPLDVRPGPSNGDLGQMWREARTVFEKPDFGPPVLPPASGPATPAEARPEQVPLIVAGAEPLQDHRGDPVQSGE